MKFTKMHGTGNDFIVVEDMSGSFLGKELVLASELCNRRFGIGGDGILLVRQSRIADIQMVIINSDGSYASMCGNGIRCFAKYIYDNSIVNKEIISIETGDGIKTAYLTLTDDKVSSVKINMGQPTFNTEKIPCSFNGEVIDKPVQIDNRIYKLTSMLMGVPHTVIFGSLAEYDVEEGKNIERYEAFPSRTNVNFCEVVNSTRVKVKTWERGAGPTLACGTGSCAAVIAANKLGFTGEVVTVEVPGGEMIISLEDNGVFMSGPAVTVFKGEYLL